MLELLGLTTTSAVLAIVVTIAAGIVKGTIGFALPLIMISGLSIIMEPKLALAAIVLPALLTNLHQTFRNGIRAALEAATEHWRFMLATCLVLTLTAQSVAIIPTHVLYLVIGVPVVTLAVIQLIGFRMTISPQHRVRAEWIIGSITGIFGGISATWGPTTVLYLLAINSPKSRQIIVQGTVYGIGSIAYLLAHLQSGIFNLENVFLSAFLILPALIGMAIGMRLQQKLDANRFRTVTLIVLVLLGFNLIRRGLFV
ncbi:MAG: sulfite exporter TauE/SafE family protein [Aestuariivita sp.]|nr:sulfite exporter TauE/SafE family protein [Aestuariivita sp.]MCY4201213.1 sulfite exporter TauE/SafE family protein [Aestuariivita sp.]MCY4288991.1 sulfite exporter TauE/SafE family protein [Aestuariivita sp.]MCY4346580.1 sulfite exporter TauE/SafE family protein [Aestuariivita sp.]